jgi:hypothetical protein
MSKLTTNYLVDVLPRVLLDVVVVDPFLFLAVEAKDEVPFFFLVVVVVALSTFSLCGNIIWDGVALSTGIMLLSVLQLAAFFCFFFGGPLHTMIGKLNAVINL